jgi:hypothetical protein
MLSEMEPIPTSTSRAAAAASSKQPMLTIP